MKKITAEIKIEYRFDSEHKGACYTLDGIHWMNLGEFAEIITKLVLGFEPKKDGNTPYNEGSDIEEINASVKSSRFTLVNKKLAETFEESIIEYFRTVHSTVWIYTVVIEKEATLYIMNKEEFESFLYRFSSLNERGVIRAKTTSTKMIQWLEERAGE